MMKEKLKEMTIRVLRMIKLVIRFGTKFDDVKLVIKTISWISEISILYNFILDYLEPVA